MDVVGGILVGAGDEVYLGELSRLSETLGILVLGSLHQQRRDGAGYLGKGKRRELGQMVGDLGADVVITDDELTSSQARILEKDSGASVVDRTELIIKIFESHARDSSSRLEVELADLEYRLPRIKGQNPAFSRLGGGAGGGRITRGPGEQQLEYDRRAIRNRIKTINRKLSDDERSRTIRGNRLKNSVDPTVALVGYTNAGKTTILNSMSGTQRPTADRLFETLETTTRRVSGDGSSDNGSGSGAGGSNFVVTDTVGFIRKLPTQLVHSFSSTLQAAHDHDLRVLCADSSSPHLSEEIETVEQTLKNLGKDLGNGNQDKRGKRGRKQTRVNEDILCLNKVDLLDDTSLRNLERLYPNAVMISARQGTERLTDAIQKAILTGSVRIQMVLPYSEYGELNLLYGEAKVHHHKDTEGGAFVDVTIPSHLIGRYADYKI